MYYTVVGVLILICQYVNELFCIAATCLGEEVPVLQTI